MSFTNTSLVEYARAQLGRPYWYGTVGDICSPELWTAKKKMYASYYSDARYEKAKARGDMGKKVHDCSGLIKGYLMSPSPDMAAKYVSKYDLSANGFHSNAQGGITGPISSIPEIPGLAVWKNNHIGIYIGNGKVIEAKGFDYGVVESDLAGSAFKEWFKLPFIEYGSDSAAPAPATPTRWRGRVVTQRDPLNIRPDPSTKRPPVGCLAKYSECYFDEERDGFAHLADGRGWCYMKYIKKIS